MNIAILGSNGYIGSILSEKLYELNYNIIKISQSSGSGVYQLNLEHPQMFNYEILQNYDYVIITAAVSSPDKCSNSYESSYQINVIGTKYFINKALEYKCKVLFFSSDAVFGADVGKCFDENSQTAADTAYGIMKKEIEDCFKSNNNFKAIRLSYVISQKDKFSSYLLKCKQRGETAEIYHPFYRSCITIDDVIDSVCWLIKNWEIINSPFLNICGSELISRVRIVDEINRISDTEIKYIVVKPGDDFFNNRPKITEMRSLYLHSILNNWDEPFSEKTNKQFKVKL